MRGQFMILLAGLTQALQVTAQFTNTTFSNDRRFLFDTNGNHVDAYGSKVNFFADKYYLYGNSFSTRGVAFGIKSYSSIDLVNWDYEGFLYDPTVANPCNDLGGCGRPHILYHSQSATYVLWANAGSVGYVVATSSSPSGPFEFLPTRALIDPAFSALQPADFAVESFGDQAYLVFSALNFRYPQAGSIWPPISQSLHISPLTPDFLNTTMVSYNIASSAFDLIDQEAESPDVFMRNGMYYVAASNTCGYCNGSIALVYRSESIQGPWTRQIIAGDGCRSQAEGILPLNSSIGETSYIWHGTSVPGGPRIGFSGHIFQPLEFNETDNSVEPLNCDASASFTLEFPKGTASSALEYSGNATKASDASPANAVYTPVCDSDQWVLFQTWEASKSGDLTQVAVNVARAGTQTVPLAFKVFKYSNTSSLEAPNYLWQDLGNATYNATSLSYTFDTASVFFVPGSAPVTKGDMLGIQIAGADFAPYCHMEYDLGTGSTNQVLFQQGQGQNSWRGLDGRTSVVYSRHGKGIKFFATVV